jgi:hypothetical protein
MYAQHVLVFLLPMLPPPLPVLLPTLLLLLPLQLPSVDSVEYWRSPDKAGWLQSQSEVMKMWRKRWFVLKQGYLFRFLSPDVSGGWQAKWCVVWEAIDLCEFAGGVYVGRVLLCACCVQAGLPVQVPVT